ncbi:DUF5689 domain-containing protein [Sphingobacterium pedocola]|nr:DUF5689 domain-containing protein [Sphingobacterium pedocola]
MKKILTYIFLMLACILVMQACEKRDFLNGTPSPYIAIEDLRQIHKGSDVQMTAERLAQAQQITGVVVSNLQSGNTPDGMINIQQARPGKLHGIALKVGNLASNYQVGDSIFVNVSNKELKRNGFLYVDGIASTDIKVITKVSRIYRRNITASAIYQRPNDYESTIVRIVGGEMFPRPEAGQTFSGVRRMVNGADTLTIRTLPTAPFADLQVPRNINVQGLLLGDSEHQGVMSIWPSSSADIEDVSDPEIPGDLGDMPLIFTGYCPDPEGGDGNYEYIQLLANTDINFAEIPFSVVTTNNATANQPNAGAAPGAGWATGGARTLKFNLTEGSVKKGEFFYVGGHQKRINGANSTSLSELNWVRAIPYASSGGDGLGDINSNILANSGHAGGMALFVGTNINEATVPIDLVFFGGLGTATVVDSVNNRGYRVANNDHYRPFHLETGEPQAFFSMGTNQYRIPHFIPANVGMFIQLGGIFNMTTRKWDTVRGYNAYLLTKQTPASALEEGELVTQQTE